MKNMLVFIDFTEVAEKAFLQAVSFCRMHQTVLYVSHIIPLGAGTDKAVIQEKLAPYVSKAKAQNVEVKLEIGIGDLFTEARNIVLKLLPEIVFVGTHGKQGVSKSLFGSAIYKLVKEIPATSVILNERSEVLSGGFKHVLLPVSSHENYLTLVDRVSKVLAEDGTVHILSIQKPGVTLSAQLVKNVEAASKWMDEHHVQWVYTELDADRYSVGYARQTLDFIHQKGMDLLAIMAKVSEENLMFGKIDKEEALLNEVGVTVLCSNSL